MLYFYCDVRELRKLTPLTFFAITCHILNFVDAPDFLQLLFLLLLQLPQHVGNGSDGRTWTSPIYDAVDVITEKLLNRSTIEPINGFTEEQLIQQKCMQNDIMKNHADYTGNICVYFCVRIWLL